MKTGFTEEEITEQNKTVEAEKAKDAEIKAKYNYIQKAENIDENGVKHVAYFKKPNRLIVGMFMAKVDEDVLTACEYIFNDTIIPEVSDVPYFFNNDDVFIGLNVMLQRLVKVKKSTFTT